MGKLSSLQDVLNGLLLDSILADYKEGELPLMQQNLDNVENIIVPDRTIFIFDRNYNAMELFVRIMSMGVYFVVRLKYGFYKEERANITSNDSPINLKLILFNFLKLVFNMLIKMKNTSKELKKNIV